MDSVISLICSRIGDVELKRSDLNTLREFSLLYIFRFIGSTAYKRALCSIPSISKEAALIISRDLLKNGFIMKNIKLWLYCLSYYGLSSKYGKKRDDTACDFGISSREYVLIPALRKLSEKFQTLHKKFKPLELDQLDGALTVACRKLKPYVGKYVNKKLRFIQIFHNFSGDDLAHELLCDGIGTALFYYPKICSDEHLLNIMKIKIRNSGSNMAEFYGNRKRCAELHRDFNMLNPMHSIERNIEASTVTLDGSQVTDDYSYILRESVRRLLSRYTDKRRDFLLLLMNYDEGFSLWLCTNGISTLPNDELLDRCTPGNYIKYCLDYLGVDYGAGLKFVAKLQYILAA